MILSAMCVLVDDDDGGAGGMDVGWWGEDEDEDEDENVVGSGKVEWIDEWMVRWLLDCSGRNQGKRDGRMGFLKKPS